MFLELNAQDINIIVSRLMCFFAVWIATSMIYADKIERIYLFVQSNHPILKIEYKNS